jgi:hypothetical protein
MQLDSIAEANPRLGAAIGWFLAFLALGVAIHFGPF